MTPTSADPLQRWATWTELSAQPGIWARWAAAWDAGPARAFVAAQGAREVWFCGAGTSAYIGEIAAAGLEGQGAFRAVPTTDIVARPSAYLTGRAPLIVQFGRSGDSPESRGLMAAMDALAPEAPRLHITCNEAGALATAPATGPAHVVTLPAETHDSGFAMTSSFSTMLLTALAIFDPAGDIARLPAMGAALQGLIPDYRRHAARGAPPERIVFLGTGALHGAAREAALKVMELTGGKVAALAETMLGFRHGPKSFIQPGTKIIAFTSSEPHAARYERDLIGELRAQFPKARLCAIGAEGDTPVPMPHGDAWAAPLLVAAAQVMGVTWGAALGLDVDDPFAGAGTLSRVVSGVRLHEVAP
ncbi:SIS domain-containing protein [Pseudoroseicyclus sp. CXY001]|uniref:SIS domain-containing protein n=1 Tax=Pseudoroseicyclus sp. CXY001 TaxID=3242492 RepID=UPI003570E81C